LLKLTIVEAPYFKITKGFLEALFQNEIMLGVVTGYLTCFIEVYLYR